ncbi:MAG: hypothetical protein KGJ78_11820 [Alphaproteobacteria bacterium]|nr:hypothetical protein [Alphaproteobacteria bacterium]
MIQLITPGRYGEFVNALSDMHRMRYRVFKERLGWDVETAGDMEVDESSVKNAERVDTARF